MISGFDHVQLAAPAGCEDDARRFFGDVLGLEELEADFAPARKAHPAFAVTEYDELQARLRGAGVELAEDDSLPGVRRCYVLDPWGNRLELVER